MKKVILICFFALVTNFIYSQKIYFIYFQTENSEPFFIRMNDKLYSSASTGYLILPHLFDSTYSFKLGFPDKDIDLGFTISINKKDHGYLIKNFGDKGWGLFDLQSLGIQMSSGPVKSSAQTNYNSSLQVNAFTDMLSKATDDPSLKQNVFFAKEDEKKTEPLQTIQKEEKKPIATDALVKEEKKPEVTNEPVTKPGAVKVESAPNISKTDSSKKDVENKPEEIYKRSSVTRISEATTQEGIESVFIDDNQKNKDTIRIFIPVEKKSIAIEESKPDSANDNKKSVDVDGLTQKARATQPETKKEDPKKDEPKKLSAELKKIWPFNKIKSDTLQAKSCQAVAGTEDFLKLRRKMAAKSDDEGMIEEAKKYFKTKCFTTEQIKNLSSMFLSSAGKYNFFKSAHNYVADAGNFSSLQSELKDAEYVSRFKATFGN